MKWLVAALTLLLQLAASQAQPLMLQAGITVGTPIPMGDIPEGATGAPVPKLTFAMETLFDIGGPWAVATEIRACGYGSTFSTPLINQPIIDKVPVRIADGSTVIYEVETIFNGSSTGTFDNTYVQVPVLLSYRLSDAWDVLAGPYVAWMVATRSNARGVGTVGIRPEIVERDMEFGDRLAEIDYGVQIGTQTSLSSSVVLDTRMVVGLVSVFDASYKTVDQALHNLYLHVGLGYRL
ncbi:MAG: PorT family protein [Candidatus Kapabacteria bacterium]|nr:PorT family protein [Candidatus Kapabacteria bacterium]